MPIRVLIADDEPLARRRLLRLLRAERDVEIVAECPDGASALAVLQEQAVDLALLDVQMPDMSGLEVAALGAARLPAVVFVTAYDAYAVQAFEVHALDYLLKPASAERVQAAVQRAREHLERVSSAQAGRRLRAVLEQLLAGERALHGLAPDIAAARRAMADVAGGTDAVPALPPPAAAAPASPPPAPAAATPGPAGAPANGATNGAAATNGPPYADRLMVRTQDRVFFVPVNDVDWFEAHGNYVRVHVGRQVHLIRETISAVEASLDPSRFARIHRGTIVNLERIRELQPWFAGDWLLILKDGTQLKLSRTYRAHLHGRLHVLA